MMNIRTTYKLPSLSTHKTNIENRTIIFKKNVYMQVNFNFNITKKITYYFLGKKTKNRFTRNTYIIVVIVFHTLHHYYIPNIKNTNLGKGRGGKKPLYSK